MVVKRTWYLQVNKPNNVADVSENFLVQLADELNNDNVTAIVLKGSCARGEATLYSDVDLAVFFYDPSKPSQHKQFYRNGRLISVSIGTIEQHRKRFLIPQEAIFVVPSTREARILLDKEGSFEKLQREAHNWTWEPLQKAANEFACEVMMDHTEIVIKALRAFLVQDELALTEMTLLIFLAVSDIVAVQRGILAYSGNSFFQQLQEAVGLDTTWTCYHRLIAGIGESPVEKSLEVRGATALRLYQETANLLRPVLQTSEHNDVIEQTVIMIEEALAH